MDLMQYGVTEGDLAFLRKKELDGDLIHLVSSEFTGDADQVTYTPADGKTFFHIKSKLYPVVNSVTMGTTTGTRNRRADVELTFDGTVIDVLTHDFEDYLTSGFAHADSTGEHNSNIFESMVGDGVKVVKLTSTNTSGTYRVSMMGWIEDT